MADQPDAKQVGLKVDPPEGVLKNTQDAAPQAAPKDGSKTTENEDTSWSFVKIALVVLIIISMVVVVAEILCVIFKIQFYNVAMSKYLKTSLAFKGKWRVFWFYSFLSFIFGILGICATIYEWYFALLVFSVFNWFNIARATYNLIEGHVLFWSVLILAVPLALLSIILIWELGAAKGEAQNGSDQPLPASSGKDAKEKDAASKV